MTRQAASAAYKFPTLLDVWETNLDLTVNGLAVSGDKYS
jgi:hypothetical protein